MNESPNPNPAVGSDLMVEQAGTASFGVPYLEAALIELELLLLQTEPVQNAASPAPPDPTQVALKAQREAYRAMIVEVRGKMKETKASWSDFYQIRRIIIGLTSGEALLGKLEHLRYEFNRLADPKIQEAYGRMESALTASVGAGDQSGPAAGTPATSAVSGIRRGNFPNDESLRAAALWLLDAIFRIITYKPRQEKVRSYLCSACTRTATMYSLLVLILGFFITWAAVQSWPPPSPSLLVFVIIAGCVGGYVSSMQRLQATSADDSSNLLTQTRLLLDTANDVGAAPTGIRKKVVWYLFSERKQLDTFKYSTIYGGIWAVVLSFLLTSGSISSPLLPDLKSLESPGLQQTYTQAAGEEKTAKAAMEKQRSALSPEVRKEVDEYLTLEEFKKSRPDDMGKGKLTAEEEKRLAALEAKPQVKGAADKLFPLVLDWKTKEKVMEDAYTRLYVWTPVGAEMSGRMSLGETKVHPFSPIHLYLGDWAGIRFVLKLLVWAFIAGFAERFVPDTLDRLVYAQKQN